MVELDIVVKEIKSYKELKESKPGEIISINGRRELLIDSGNAHIARFNYNPDKIYTISFEGNYVVQNHYDNYVGNDNIHLEPFMKTSCRIDSDTALENELCIIAKQGGLEL
jgi:hypothetical protein